MSVLIVGLATDGPSNEVVVPRDLRELNSIFGGSWVERYSVTPAATSQVLTYEPWATVSNTVNGKQNKLYHPTVSGSSLLFGNIGGSANSALELRYTPYLGKSDLIYAGKRHASLLGTVPAVLRLGGTNASLSSDNWKFVSKYAGTKYNKVRITTTSTTLTVSGLEPNYPTLTYTGDAESIVAYLKRDFYLGLSPVMVQDFTGTIPTINALLTGGTNGALNDTELANLFSYVDIPASVTAICVLGPVGSGFVSALEAESTSTYYQPRLVFAQSPEYDEDFDLWMSDLSTTLPFRHNMLSLFLGEVGSNLEGREVSRYLCEEAFISYQLKATGNITNTPLKVTTFQPKLSETQLSYAKTLGVVAPVRYIRGDISLNEGVMSDGSDFLYSSKIVEVFSITSEYVSQFQGRMLNQGDKPDMASTLQGLLTTLQFFTVDSVRIVVVDDSMYVEINGNIANEILSISFAIRNR